MLWDWHDNSKKKPASIFDYLKDAGCKERREMAKSRNAWRTQFKKSKNVNFEEWKVDIYGNLKFWYRFLEDGGKILLCAYGVHSGHVLKYYCVHTVYLLVTFWNIALCILCTVHTGHVLKYCSVHTVYSTCWSRSEITLRSMVDVH